MMHMSKESNLPLTETEPATEALPFVDASAIRIGLFGDVQGTGATELKQLQSALQLEGDVLVSCEGLVRVDFSAAGSILNWVASAQAMGKKIEFCSLSYLVATFFNLVGINEHARVSARAN
jgi:anti-anti-sigma regulatory factor